MNHREWGPNCVAIEVHDHYATARFFFEFFILSFAEDVSMFFQELEVQVRIAYHDESKNRFQLFCLSDLYLYL